MPRQHTSPIISDTKRLQRFQEGTCPYCGSVEIAVDTRLSKTSQHYHVVKTYTCQQCGATGKRSEVTK
ncbi:MAG: hypothetical protein PHC39_04920 [Proteiniphilum sp.]|nr:hypothetical protein [Proteiniphilum sp.]